jgi:hypothetical protein
MARFKIILLIILSIDMYPIKKIDLEYLNSKFEFEKFEELEINNENSSNYIESVKYDYSLKSKYNYYFLDSKISDLYVKVENDRVIKFKIILSNYNSNFFNLLGNELGNPKTITFLNKSYELKFKEKFKRGEIKEPEDIDFTKIKFCHWSINDKIVSYNNYMGSEITSKSDKIEFYFSSRI